MDRLSVNPQTMSDSVLEAIGRRHTAQDILEALELVRACGGFAVNMDLIAGLPTDTPEGFSRTLDAVLELAPENVTVHTLSLKRGSGLALAGRGLPEAEEVRLMLDESMARLRAAGYAPYYLYRQKNMAGGFENTGWARPGFENLYNICIMEELCSIIATVSYTHLDVYKRQIIALAKKRGVDAIHPGYGFLSENAAFALACEEAGIKFIGPPSRVLARMGDKLEAKKIAVACGVPVIPGTREPLKNAEEALEKAAEFGYPVILKAAAGGGGRGMRLCEKPEDVAPAFELVSNEERKRCV